MPVSTKIFKIDNYPDSFPVHTLPTHSGFQDDFTLQTEVTELGVGEYQEKELKKLMVNHDRGKKFEGVGYSAESGRIEDLVGVAEEKEFPSFVFPERDYLISAYSSKDVFNQAFKRLRKYNADYTSEENRSLDAKPLNIDLQKLKESYEESGEGPAVRGGWFRELRVTNVDVAYIGGGGVDDSDEWFKYETSGKISALRLDFPQPDPDDEPYRLLLTRDGAIHCYKSFSENQLLNIVVPIFEYILSFEEQ